MTGLDAREYSSDALAGEFLRRYGHIEGAAQLFERSLEQNDDPFVHAKLAEALKYLDDLPGALEHYEVARRLVRDLVGSTIDDGIFDSNLGMVLTMQGRLEEAVEAHRRALGTTTQGAMASRSLYLIWNAAHTLLACGRLSEGWDAYEARVPLGLGPPKGTELPVWGAAGLRHETALVLPEQGIGDEVLFASCFRDLIGEAALVYIEADPRLVPLFARSFPSARVGARGQWSAAYAGAHPPERPESVIAAGSLARRYRKSLADFPADKAYLREDTARATTWRLRLEDLPPGPRIGISWRSLPGGPERLREYAPLGEWAPVLSAPGAQFVNLQYGDCEAELRETELALGVTIYRPDDVDLRDDLDEVGALVSTLDLVLAPRNSVAHLAGALGIETIMVANPHVWTELGTGAMPWFPAVTVAHREPGGSWTKPIMWAASRVRQLAATSRG